MRSGDWSRPHARSVSPRPPGHQQHQAHQLASTRTITNTGCGGAPGSSLGRAGQSPRGFGRIESRAAGRLWCSGLVHAPVCPMRRRRSTANQHRYVAVEDHLVVSLPVAGGQSRASRAKPSRSGRLFLRGADDRRPGPCIDLVAAVAMHTCSLRALAARRPDSAGIGGGLPGVGRLVGLDDLGEVDRSGERCDHVERVQRAPSRAASSMPVSTASGTVRNRQWAAGCA